MNSNLEMIGEMGGILKYETQFRDHFGKEFTYWRPF